jgi:hypothetical protein
LEFWRKGSLAPLSPFKPRRNTEGWICNNNMRYTSASCYYYGVFAQLRLRQRGRSCHQHRNFLERATKPFVTCLSELHRLRRSLIKKCIDRKEHRPCNDYIAADARSVVTTWHGCLFYHALPAVIRKNAIDRTWWPARNLY